MGLVGLTLFSVACRPEIHNHLRWRRLHVSANVLATLIVLAQGLLLVSSITKPLPFAMSRDNAASSSSRRGWTPEVAAAPHSGAQQRPRPRPAPR
nr:DUF4079 family protein [Synechococcus sp. MW101C3]